MSAILVRNGVRYVNADVMLTACKHPHIVVNAALMLKTGVEQGESLESILSHLLANFVLDISGQSAGVLFSQERLDEMIAEMRSRRPGVQGGGS